MSLKIYQCETESKIKIISQEDYPWEFTQSQFCIVEKYTSLYKKALNRFDQNTPYALPGRDKEIRIYNGIDREPAEFTPDDMDQYSADEAMAYYKELNNDNLELLFYRMTGSEDEVPANMRFIGFDVGYPFGMGCGDGFSAVCDCMFLCRWHGCDDKGTEFLKEFQQLNENGLFDSAETAVNYLYHYLSLDWSERGYFCVFEIYEPMCET